MSPERWQQVDRLLQSALEQPPGERDGFLQQSCGGDAALEREVRSLLAAQQEAGSFLESPAMEMAAQALAAQQEGGGPEGIGDRAEGQARGLPSRVGHYQVVRLLGEGGMGVVYEAVQEHPHRTVALKVVKPGLAPSALRRFEHESEALARLQHPGIAQVYEAGTADTGAGLQPYFAMEFIRGQHLREYTEARHLSVRARLELMIKICEAVDHAHQRGLIHRDLKPGNILVDDTGQPKILDFGMARITESETQVTRHTDFGQLVGTLEYMSPEQVAADPTELDTRTDVYALGVILYEMLAGRRPYKLSRQLPEAVETIREKDPPPLSTIDRQYRGDIETIVTKALEKDKARRYESVGALAADIQLYLTDEPIAARPPSATYQLRKFARRHKALVSGIAAVLMVLLAGIAASTWQATIAVRERNRAVAERQRADTEAATARAVNEFLQNDLLAQASAATQAGPNRKPDPNLTVRTALDQAAARITGKFDKQPLVEASIRQTIGTTYKDLGLYPDAERQIDRAVELRRRILGDGNPDTLRSMTNLAELYSNQGKYSQAEPLFTKVVEAQRRALGERHLDTQTTMNDLAELYFNQGRYAQAEGLWTKVLAIRRRFLGEENPTTLHSMNNLAILYLNQGEYAQAEPLFEKVVEVQHRLLGDEHPDALTGISNLGLVYLSQRKYANAEPLWAKVLEVRLRVLGPDHPDTLISMNNLAGLYREQLKYAKAEPLFIRVLEVRRRLLGGEHPDTLRSMSNLAGLYREEGKYARAEPTYLKVLEARRRLLGDEHPDTLLSMNNVGLIYLAKGEYQQADRLFTHVLDVRRRVLSPGHPSTASTEASLGRIRLEQQKYAEAEILLREALKIQASKSPNSWERFNTETLLGASLAEQARYAEAEPLLISGYQGLLRQESLIPWESRPAVKQAGERIVRLYQAWGNPQKAAEWAKVQQGKSAGSPQNQ